MLKFYALCCRNMYALKRHQKTIPIEDLVIVINTLDDTFREEATAYCQEQGIEHYVTESNGGPSMGKNSVFDIFEASDNEYMVLVDGDDFLTPHGVWTYKEIAKQSFVPDTIALQYQWTIRAEWGYSVDVGGLDDTNLINPSIGTRSDSRLDPSKTHGVVARAFWQPPEYWDIALRGKYIPMYEGNDHSVNLAEVHQKWTQHCYKYIDKKETHLRLIFFSKNLVSQGFRFNLDFTVGEDTLMYLDLKRAHIEGNIQMRHYLDRYPTYIYDQRVGGVVAEQKDVGGIDWGWFLWLLQLTEEYDRYEAEGIMSEEEIPMYTVRVKSEVDEEWFEEKVYDHQTQEDNSLKCDLAWPPDYRPDLMGLVSYPGKFHPFY